MKAAGAWLVAALLLAGCDPGPTGAGPDTTAADSTITAVEAVDGDSLVGEDGTRYRLIGINAPDPPECLADEAFGRLTDLVEQGVGLGPDVEPTDQFGRRLVYVHLPAAAPGGPGLANARLVAEGLAVAIHSEPNSAMRDVIFAAQERARQESLGLWNPESCGSGPLAPITIRAVVADPPGPDDQVLDQENVLLANEGDDTVDLTGWVIRDESTQNRFRFPAGFVLAPGDEVTVTSGEGNLGFGLGSPIWNNTGDTAFVVDDQGRFVTYFVVSD